MARFIHDIMSFVAAFLFFHVVPGCVQHSSGKLVVPKRSGNEQLRELGVLPAAN